MTSHDMTTTSDVKLSNLRPPHVHQRALPGGGGVAGEKGAALALRYSRLLARARGDILANDQPRDITGLSHYKWLFRRQQNRGIIFKFSYLSYQRHIIVVGIAVREAIV